MTNKLDCNVQVYGFVPDSIVDGPGLRYSVFVQGCSHSCPGCHNPESQPAEGGTVHTAQQIYDDIRSNKLVHAVTFSGGEPMEQPQACAALAQALKEDGYNIWVYTGYLFEDLLAKAESGTAEGVAIGELLNNTDVLVDGPFVESLQSYDLDWRGSSNQRLIDVAKSLSSGTVVEWKQPEFTFELPESW